MNNNASRRLVVNIANITAVPQIYCVTPDRLSAALKKHEGVTDLAEFRIGTDYDDIDDIVESADILFTSLMGLTFPLKRLSAASKLKYVHYIGSGIDHLLPLDWMPAGAVMTKSLGAHMPVAAEYGLTTLLMLNNKMPWYVTNQRNHNWERKFISTVQGKTVAVIGVGAIGGAVAGLAKKLGFKVLGVRRSGEPHENVDEMFGPDALHKVLARADFVFLSAALTDTTHKLIGRKEFDIMKPGAGFSSISRGQVLDWDALRTKLSDGHLSGAIVNGYEAEPVPSDSPLWDTPNLLLTPHIGTQDDNNYIVRCLDILCNNIKRYVAGQPLLHQVQPDRGY
ncbi:D-2-hydroxyacid dehydrogenase [Bradyrhizobium sp. B124]|uniref:D-2-hydroxyacid dehydrogenase n=1 Tax=Bradyrhizobium sp. B124 TaxID=3140245 RepID=UPI003183568B